MRLAAGLAAARLLAGQEMARGAAQPQGPCATAQAGHRRLCPAVAGGHLEVEDRPDHACGAGLEDELSAPPGVGIGLNPELQHEAIFGKRRATRTRPWWVKHSTVR